MEKEFDTNGLVRDYALSAFMNTSGLDFAYAFQS